MAAFTIEEEENHVFNKEKAQRLVNEIYPLICLALDFCKSEFLSYENGDTIIYLLKHIEKVCYRLHFELDALDVYEESLLK